MGVSLSGLVQGREIALESLNDRVVAIDAFNAIYQFLSTIRDRFTGEPLRDAKGQVTSHLSGLFYRTIRLLDAGVRPLYVFDGEPPAFKRRTIEERMRIRAEAEAKWKEAVERGDAEKVRMYAQGASRLTEAMVEQSKQLLGLMGVPWLQAPSEGEAQATHLLKQGRAWAVGSQDWDSLLFGAERVVRNLTMTGRKKVARKEQYTEVRPELVQLQDVLGALGITHDQLIMLGILVGTDYNPGGVKGVGPKTALKLVKEHRTLKVFDAVAWEGDVPPEEIFDFFAHPPVRDVAIEKQRLQPGELARFLCEEHDFGRERIQAFIAKLAAGQQRKQQGLGGFFR